MRIPNNVIPLNVTMGLDFFKKWFILIKPFHNLADREIDILAALVKERYELSKVITDEAVLDMVSMNEDTKKKVREECNVALPHFRVIMSKLKKNKVIVDNKINPRLIPNIRQDDNGMFQLMFLFKIQDELQ